jgi:hypothetical protein
MGRPKGSKNRSTILREAQETIVARGLMGHEQEFLDSLHVMEIGMRHFLTGNDCQGKQRKAGGG